MTFDDYKDIVGNARKIAYRVYTECREERTFLKNDNNFNLSMTFMVWLFLGCIVTLVLSEWLEESTDANEMEVKATKTTDWQIAIIVLYSISLFGLLVLTLINFFRTPPKNIFSTYE